MMMRKGSVFCLCLFFFAQALFPQTIAEKKRELLGQKTESQGELSPRLEELARLIKDLKKELVEQYVELSLIHNQIPFDKEKEEGKLEEIRLLKGEILELENSFRQEFTDQTPEEFALFHAPETTVGQLIIDYGSLEYVYLMSPDVAKVPLSLSSNIPIPRSSWGQMLEVILDQSGLGIRQLTPFLREVYFLDKDQSSIATITSDRNDLQLYPLKTRICFVLTPDPSDLRRLWLFLEKFVNPATTRLQLLGRDIMIIAEVGQIGEILKLYDFAVANRGMKDFKIIPLSRVDADEMANVLNMIFRQFEDTSKRLEQNGTAAPRQEATEPETVGLLQVIPLTKLARALFLVGTKSEIEKAENIIADVEDKVALARDKTVYTYSVRHSEPEGLAEILYRIYSLMVDTGVGFEEGVPTGDSTQQINRQQADAGVDVKFTGIQRPPFYNAGTYDGQGYTVNPPIIGTSSLEPPKANVGRGNFIVDLKTGTIVMVVEQDLLPKLLSILKTLDVPKKMVQIEVLLFEKKLRRDTNYGLKFLRTGCKASGVNCESVAFNNANPIGGFAQAVIENLGLFQFCVSRAKSSGIPAYDLCYNFLISQDDVQINSAPSVLALNQTPAVVTIRDEFSIKTATFSTPSSGGAAVIEESFTRKQYGITIQVTPTIHTLGRGEVKGMTPIDYLDASNVPYVTLDSIITFENPQPTGNDQPIVAQREVKNIVSIPDGQTVIMGGLRRKVATTRKDAIPFIGELPGIGKLFSWNEISSEDTDMYIFMTPKIIYDPVHDLLRIRTRELCKRPGDIPEYLCRLYYSRELKAKETMEGTMTIFFGQPLDRCICTEGEYDGRSCPRCGR